jgi:predicted RNase H-like HicB family nuclease
MAMQHDYTVVYQPIEEGWIMATVPELPGAVTQGATLEEARANIKDAVELLLQSYREDALSQAPAGAIVETLVVNMIGDTRRLTTLRRSVADDASAKRR